MCAKINFGMINYLATYDVVDANSTEETIAAGNILFEKKYKHNILLRLLY
jgi:hypothetical protein